MFQCFCDAFSGSTDTKRTVQVGLGSCEAMCIGIVLLERALAQDTSTLNDGHSTRSKHLRRNGAACFRTLSMPNQQSAHGHLKNSPGRRFFAVLIV